jgi:glycosyltransferase involved in cell wall biosynthesis
MQLVFTSTAYPPSVGGAQILSHQLAIQLSKRHHVQVVSLWDTHRTDWLTGTTLRANSAARDYQIDGIDVHQPGFSLGEKAAMLPGVLAYYPLMDSAANYLAGFIEGKLSTVVRDADLIHNTRMGREPISLASLHLARKLNIPFVLTPVHHPRWKGWLYRIYNQLYREADALLALTQAEKQILVDLGVKEEKILITGMGPILAEQANPARFLTSAHIQQPFILFLGQHYPYKGFVQLLASAQLVWQKHPEAHFVFIGPGVRGSEQHFAQSPDPRIHRLGQVDLQTKTDALAACAALCVPSMQESFGGVYTEAWSLKKPVIGCPIPAVREVITDGVDGLLVEQTPAAIAERILYLLDHPVEGQAMGEAGYQKVAARYTWEQLAARTEQVYQGLI